MLEKIKCPHCKWKSDIDFTDMCDQDGEYNVECPHCEEVFEVATVWEFSVMVICPICKKDEEWCECT